MTRTILLSLSLLLLCSQLPAGVSIIGTRVPNFVIEDQFERQWNASRFRGTTTVFVLSDRSGYEYSPNWTKVLVPRFKAKAVRFVPVADVQEVPGFLKGFIRGKFQEEFKYTILMDWEGILTSAFKMTKGVPNLVVVNKEGIVQHAAHGKGSTEQIETFARKLEQILASK